MTYQELDAAYRAGKLDSEGITLMFYREMEWRSTAMHLTSMDRISGEINIDKINKMLKEVNLTVEELDKRVARKIAA